jgi:hypothetical protein
VGGAFYKYRIAMNKKLIIIAALFVAGTVFAESIPVPPVRDVRGNAGQPKKGHVVLTPDDFGLGLAEKLSHWAEMGGVLPLTNCPPSSDALAAAAAMGFDPEHIVCVIFPGHNAHPIGVQMNITGNLPISTGAGSVTLQGANVTIAANGLIASSATGTGLTLGAASILSAAGNISLAGAGADTLPAASSAAAANNLSRSGAGSGTIGPAASMASASNPTVSGSSSATIGTAASTASASNPANSGSGGPTLGQTSITIAANAITQNGVGSVTLSGVTLVSVANGLTASQSGGNTVSLSGASLTITANGMTAAGTASITITGAPLTMTAAGLSPAGAGTYTLTSNAETFSAGALSRSGAGASTLTSGSATAGAGSISHSGAGGNTLGSATVSSAASAVTTTSTGGGSAPDTPGSFSLSNSPLQLTGIWAASSGATGYKFYYSLYSNLSSTWDGANTYSGQTVTSGVITLGSVTDYTISSGLTGSTRYYARISATNSSGESALASAQSATAASAPDIYDTFTGSDGAQLNATYWTQSTGWTIQGNAAQSSNSSPVRTVIDVTKSSSLYVKANVSVPAGANYEEEIWIQDKASVGTSHNYVDMYLTYKDINGACDGSGGEGYSGNNPGLCTDDGGNWIPGYAYLVVLQSFDNSGTGSNLNSSSNVTSGDLLEIRFSGTNQVNLYKNGSLLFGPYTSTATLGSLVRAQAVCLVGSASIDNFAMGNY